MAEPVVSLDGTLTSLTETASVVSDGAVMASTQPTGVPRWKQLAKKATLEMAASAPEEKRAASLGHARRAVNAFVKSSEPLEENIERFAERLVETFGSLAKAFEEFDLHGREEITRSQWDAALNARGWEPEEICGISASKLFSLVCRASKKPTGALTLPAWKSFFKKWPERIHAQHAM